LQEKADAWKVQLLTGIEVWQPENYWIGEINKRLRKEALVCYVLRRPVAEVRSRLRLPMHFAIYPISDRYSFHDAVAPILLPSASQLCCWIRLLTRSKVKE
jgi:CRISPR-associated endonuclease/helicase Cas3